MKNLKYVTERGFDIFNFISKVMGAIILNHFNDCAGCDGKNKSKFGKIAFISIVLHIACRTSKHKACLIHTMDGLIINNTFDHGKSFFIGGLRQALKMTKNSLTRMM